jgi:hypothetical protein
LKQYFSGFQLIENLLFSQLRKWNVNKFLVAFAFLGTGFLVFKGVGLLRGSYLFFLIIGSLLNFFVMIAKISEYWDNLDLPEKKQKVVILGSGWGGLAMLRSINTNKFDVHLVSPRNYFMFTPLLADSTVGSVDASRYFPTLRVRVRVILMDKSNVGLCNLFNILNV